MIQTIPDYLIEYAALAATNQVFLPLLESAAISMAHHEIPFESENIGMLSVPYSEIKKYAGRLTDKSLNAVDFVNVACGLAHQKAKYRGVCKHYSDTTYKVFRKLVKLNSRDDLKNGVNICLVNKVSKNWGGDVYLRVETNGKNINYETMRKKKTAPLLEPEKVSDFSKENFEMVQKLNLDKEPDVIYSSKLGFAYPTFKGVTKLGGFISEAASTSVLAGRQIYNKARETFENYFSKPDYL